MDEDVDMELVELQDELSVEEILGKWPETVKVFLHYRMGCVGCTMSPYETISSAAAIYQLPLEQFLDDLKKAIDP
jgi:hybrid cluster-associated redox disulfide protein